MYSDCSGLANFHLLKEYSFVIHVVVLIGFILYQEMVNI